MPPSRPLLNRFSLRRQTSFERLAHYERLMLSSLSTPYEVYMMPILLDGVSYNINTFETIPPEPAPADFCEYPLVLVHGFGGGLGVFVKNIDPLSAKYKVIALDVLGCGKSCRPRFPTEPEAAEDLLVEALEAWRAAMGIEKMILLGHSFGGYQTTAYALRYPQYIKHLILADPWGFPLRPENPVLSMPLWLRVMSNVLRPFSPLALLRAFGPLGPRVFEHIRPDLKEKFADKLDQARLIYYYLYHLNALRPSAELAFQTLTHPYGWAKLPLITRAPAIDPEVPITFIYAHHSSMDNRMGGVLKLLRPGSRVDVNIIPHTTHHVYCDDSRQFNDHVIRVADFLEPRITYV
eukprot:m.65511 g.65511  ORF g.65511 m.65511 type:complete len:350 (+) comp12607_c2_seq1:290-1339(+)